MKLIEEILLTRSHYGPAGSQVKRYSISDQPIDEFISHLDEQGVKIDPDYSEKRVRYHLNTEGGVVERDSTAPLAAQFPEGSEVETFYLRDGSGLELEISNYDHSSPQRKGVIGGSVLRSSGITCKLTIERKTVDSSVVEKVRKAMEDTYQRDDI